MEVRFHCDLAVVLHICECKVSFIISLIILVRDLMERGNINLSSLKFHVLDEAGL